MMYKPNNSPTIVFVKKKKKKSNYCIVISYN